MDYKNQDKTLLILDLDETLIHATKSPLERPADFQVAFYHVYRRPFLQEFIQLVRRHFLLAVWSSASDDYVAEMVGHIFGDPADLEFAWGRSRCTYRIHPLFDEYRTIRRDYQNPYSYLKTLKKVKRLGYRFERILMIDDTPEKLIRNYGNAIYLEEYLGAPQDRELPLLGKYLLKLKDEKNVRTIEKRNWRWKTEKDLETGTN